MAGEDQERFEEYVELERYIDDLQAGRVAHAPAALTPELARLYQMALLLHAASSEAAAPRPEFTAELEARLQGEEARQRAPLKRHRPRSSSQERKASSRVSRRALLRTGAVVAASLSVGAGMDHALEERRLAAVTTAKSPWMPLVPDAIPTTEHFVTTLDQLGEQPVPFSAGGIVGYLVRTDAERSDPTAGLVIALSAACTHMGCLVNWERSDRLFRCPCHGGVFSAVGMTVTTPATIRYLAPLPRVETIIDPAGNIFVRVPAQPSSIP
jgi:Rieske Fe-S protein